MRRITLDEMKTKTADLLLPEPTPPIAAPSSFDVRAFLDRNGMGYTVATTTGGGVKYILKTCPFDESHTAPDSAVFVTPDGAIGFKCFHNSCSGYRWHDLRQKLEPRPEYRPEYKQATTQKESIKPEPQQPSGPVSTTLAEATQRYADALKGGGTTLVNLGLPELDHALGGGVEFGEMIMFAARPSHGKSMAAMQCVHHWTDNKHPVLVISEEMSAMSLGKRSLQFLSNTPQEHWSHSAEQIDRDITKHFSDRAKCHIVESCGTVSAAVAMIEKHVNEHGVRHVVIDYAQLLQSTGKGRYEQITNVSIELRKAISKHKLVAIVLAQLNREIEHRNKFVPTMADIKETGQFEQDADVIVFLVWPFRITQTGDPGEYQFFVAKNRNREIKNYAINCRFEPSRQRLTQTKLTERVRDEDRIKEFDVWNADMSGERYR